MLLCVIVGNVADVSEVGADFVFGAEGSMYLQNVDSIAHNHAVQQPNNRTNVINHIY
jgi:hypothetical protein